MSIIAISRGTLSGTLPLSRRIADDLNYRVVMREEVYDAARPYGIADSGLGIVGIADDQPPSFWHRFTDQKRLYLACFSAALLDLALEGRVVYVGHFAHLLLKGYPPVLRVRLAAPDVYRIARLRVERGVSRDEASRIVRDVDDRRLKWSQFLYGIDWRDPTHYDLVINPEKIDLATAAGVVVNVARSPAFQPTQDDIAGLRSQRLAAVVRVALLRSLHQAGDELQVRADVASGAVTVAGNPPAMVADVWEQEIRGVVSRVEGVTSVAVVHGIPSLTTA